MAHPDVDQSDTQHSCPTQKHTRQDRKTGHNKGSFAHFSQELRVFASSSTNLRLSYRGRAMKDVFGNALQKMIPHPRSKAAIPTPHTATALQECTDDTDSSDEIPEYATVPISAEVSAANAQRSKLEFLLDHRRPTAAVVVLVCMAIVWFDDTQGIGRSGVSGESAAQTSESSVDSLLSEFDAVEVRPLREPADPVETSPQDPFPFSIPPAESATAANDDTTTPAVSTATEAVSAAQDNGGSAKHIGSNHSTFGPASSSVSRNARLTGQIQPLK